MDGCQPGQSRGFKKEKTKMTFKFSGQYFRKSMETDRFENLHPDFILLLS